MRNNYPPTNDSSKTWTSREAYLLAMVCLFAGLVAGYLFRGSSSPVAQPSAAAPGATTPGMPPVGGGSGGMQSLQTPESLNPVVQPLLDALKLDPKNGETLTKLGDMYFDHKFYPEAIKYYQRALEVRPTDVNARTDMGTALYYSGFPEKALAEFQKSLAIDPSHAQTLFNLGIVRRDGLKDPAGAVAAWEKLLQTNPNHPNKQQVLDLIAQTKAQKN